MAFYHPDQDLLQHLHGLRLPHLPLFAFRRIHNRYEHLDLERRSVDGDLVPRSEEWGAAEGPIQEAPAFSTPLRFAFRDLFRVPCPRVASVNDLGLERDRFQRTRIVFEELPVFPKDESRGGDVDFQRVWEGNQVLCCR